LLRHTLRHIGIPGGEVGHAIVSAAR
jgi:hypothetical protein